MAKTPAATTSRDGTRRVSTNVTFRISFRDAVNAFHWHITDLHIRGEDGEAQFANMTPSALRKIIAEDLYLHGTIAFERDSEDWDDQFWTTAEEIARKAYPGLDGR